MRALPSEMPSSLIPFSLHQELLCHMNRLGEATWRSGYAADCKSVYSGSIPDVASNLSLLVRLPVMRPLRILEAFICGRYAPA